jgi:hypothetical protein
MTSPRIVTALALLLVASGCSSPTTRVVCRPEFRNTELSLPPPPPPSPQVMIAAPLALPSGQRTVATISEEERTEMLRAAGSPIAPYSPAPLYEPTDRTVVVERAAYGDRYACDTGYPRYYGPGYGPGFGIARAAAYTGMGAIIGHQFHDQGAGAAIGAGFALLTTPWWGIGGWNSCWDN